MHLSESYSVKKEHPFVTDNLAVFFGDTVCAQAYILELNMWLR